MDFHWDSAFGDDIEDKNVIAIEARPSFRKDGMEIETLSKGLNRGRHSQHELKDYGCGQGLKTAFSGLGTTRK